MNKQCTRKGWINNDCDDDDDDVVTLGVSVVLCNHRHLHPDSVWSSSHLHRSTHQSDATTSSRSPNQTLSKHFEHRERSSAGCDIKSLAVLHRRRQSNSQDPNVHQRRLLSSLVAVRGAGRGTEHRQLVQAAVRRRVRRYVARQRQQRSQRVHLLVDQQTVQT